MDYRDQLKYIKSHQMPEEEMESLRIKRRKQMHENGGKRRRERRNQKDDEWVQRQKPRKIGFLSYLLFIIQLASSVFFMAAMAWLHILPTLYMAVIGVLLFILMLLVRGLQKRARKSRKRRTTGKTFSFVLSFLLIVAGLYGLKVNEALDKIAVGEESGKYTSQHMVPVTEQSFNVYISGIDVYGDIDQESRSDVNLIATVNPKTHKILLTTTPRDYYVVIPGVSGEERDKLTHAGTYGIETSMATLENLYDTKIDFFVRVNFTSVEEIVDILGGVDVESELAFKTSKAAGKVVKVKKGKNHFNGKEALAFVRERKALPTGDNQRGKNQQALLTALIKKTMSPDIVLRANGMINSVAGNADTNLSEEQIKSLIRMHLKDRKSWKVESIAAEGNDTGKQYCYSYKGKPLYVTVPYEDSVEEIKRKITSTLGN